MLAIQATAHFTTEHDEDTSVEFRAMDGAHGGASGTCPPSLAALWRCPRGPLWAAGAGGGSWARGEARGGAGRRVATSGFGEPLLDSRGFCVFCMLLSAGILMGSLQPLPPHCKGGHTATTPPPSVFARRGSWPCRWRGRSLLLRFKGGQYISPSKSAVRPRLCCMRRRRIELGGAFFSPWRRPVRVRSVLVRFVSSSEGIGRLRRRGSWRRRPRTSPRL